MILHISVVSFVTTPFSVCNILFLFFFLELRLWHMDVPSPGVETELQLLACVTAIAMPDPSGSVTYTIALGNVLSLTY